MQEGTLKQINKDRNQKTTRNIQEGLPFDINDVKKQTEDAKLLAWLSVSSQPLGYYPEALPGHCTH